MSAGARVACRNVEAGKQTRKACRLHASRYLDTIGTEISRTDLQQVARGITGKGDTQAAIAGSEDLAERNTCVPHGCHQRPQRVVIGRTEVFFDFHAFLAPDRQHSRSRDLESRHAVVDYPALNNVFLAWIVQCESANSRSDRRPRSPGSRLCRRPRHRAIIYDATVKRRRRGIVTVA